MKLNARTISQVEHEQLLALAAGPDMAVARRARAVLWALDGREMGDIAQALGLSERSVWRALQQFRAAGVDGLEQRGCSPGRTQSVSHAQRKGLLALLQRSPEDFGCSTPRWNLADLAAVVKREGVLGAVSYWTLRRELARIIQREPELKERLHLPDQPRPGAPRGNGNALRHGACGRQPRSGDERALLAEIEADLRRDFPGAGESEAGAGLIREAAVAFMQYSRSIPADFRETDRRTILRWRKALRELKAAAEKPKVVHASKITPAEWASDLLERYRKFESNGNG